MEPVQKKLIVIIGDSWGMGEWTASNNKIAVSHPGLQFYLEQHSTFEVINLSTAADDSHQMVEKYRYYLETHNWPKVHSVVCFLPPPRRVGQDFWTFKLEFKKYLKREKREIKRSLFELYKHTRQSEHQSHTTNVILLGALTKIQASDVKEFYNFRVAISSIVEFLHPGFKHWPIWVEEQIHQVTPRLSKDLVYEIWQCHQLWNHVAFKSKYFKKDYGHPDRVAHKRIYDFLISNNFFS